MSGSELTNPDELGAASASVTAGLNQDVFELHWSGGANAILYTLPNAWPQIKAWSFLCAPQSCSCLTFEITAPTPVTLAANGSVTGSHRATAHAGLGSPTTGTLVDNDIVIHALDPPQSFDRRFSTFLSPGVYTLYYEAYAIAGEGATGNASASLDIVMTLSPVGDCSDGLDNDNDNLVDLDDSDCEDGTDASKAAPPPGVPALGTAGLSIALTTLLLLAPYHLRARRRA